MQLQKSLTTSHLSDLPPRGPMTYGVDGAKAGWVIVGRGPDPDDDCLILTAQWPFGAADRHIVVDMPIGLADSGDRGCERLARAELPRYAKSSVFPVPVRGALAQDNWADANAWSKARTGKGIPQQAWGLRDKLLELDRSISAQDQNFIHEGHPELAFRKLAGHPDLAPKKKKEGKAQRRALLIAAGFTKLDQWTASLPRKWVAVDDIYDAAVLTLTASHIAKGTATCLTDDSIPRDAKGRRMEIWF